MKNFPPPYVVISSAHDYRSRRRANIHFITDELSRRGNTLFISTHSSILSKMKGRDNRFRSHSLYEITRNGVACFLWHSLAHPVNVNGVVGSLWNPVANAIYRKTVPKNIIQAIAGAGTIIVESGSAVALISLIQSVSPGASIIYNASDSLSTVGMAKYYHEELERVAKHITYVRLPSALMTADHMAIKNQRVIRHGLVDSFFAPDLVDPYPPGINVVSVGSMLFDKEFFDIVGPAFPDVNFYVIGSGHSETRNSNVKWLPEMAFAETIPYVRYSAVGVAPYRSAISSHYLIDTSMKLLQFEAAGIPAVCPDFVQGGKPSRVGYRVGDPQSIIRAMGKALKMGRTGAGAVRTWSQVVDDMLIVDWPNL